MAIRALSLIVALALGQAALLGPRPALADTDPGGALAISSIVGDVGVQRGDDQQPVAAVRNAPLLPGDILSTGAGSYAEIHMGRGIRLRLDAQSQIRVAAIDPNGSEVQLGQGNVELRVFAAGNNAQVDTPQVALVGDRPGTYVVSVLADGTSTVSALGGNGTVLAQTGQQSLSAGQTIHASGSADAPVLEPAASIALDPAFVSWNQTRDGMLARAFAQRQAAAQMDGAEDLAGYGRWTNTPYGPAWVPAEPASWTPYSAGQWVYEPFYGYVWVGSEPWGWAPYHYGRWFVQPGVGWAWAPGPPAPWSPALVAFVQTAQAIAWLALAPRDPFYPWWGPHATTVFVTNVNVYRNVHVAHAFISTPIAEFRAGNFTHVRTVAYANLGNPRFVNVTRVVVPTRANLAFTSRRVTVALPHPVAAFNSPAARFVGHPIAVQRTPFGTRTTTVTTTPARPVFGPVDQKSGNYRTYGPPPSYGRPATTNTYQRPTTTNTYQRPTTTNTYQRPTTTNTYQRPTTTNTYQRPTTTNTYQRPTTTNTYQRPTTTNTYQRPTTTNTYRRPATVSRPTPRPRPTR